MAESTLSLTYTDYVREVARRFGLGSVYATGTIGIASGVVTLTSGVFPAWSALGTLSVSGSLYKVATRDTATQVTLEDTSVSVSSGAAYVLMEAGEEDARSTEAAIGAGYRRFLYPPPLVVGDEKKPQQVLHQWSFLNPVASLSLVNADYDYDLPDDFGQDLKDVTYAAGTAQIPVAIVSERELRAMQSQDAATGAPRYICWRPKAAFAGTDGQRFEAVVYPTPDNSYTLSYNYNVAPGKLTPTAKYPYGGAVHAETILTGVLAAAEELFDDENAEYAVKYRDALAASIQIDQRAARVETDSYQNTAVTYGTYDWLAQEVGSYLGVSANPKTWDHPTKQRVDSIIQRGVKQFEMPVALGGKYSSHRWSFMRPVTTLTTVAAYSTGTIGIVDGVVTLTDGAFPSWAAEGEVTVNGVTYTVDTRDSGTQLTLDDTTVDVDSGTTYVLGRPTYDLDATFGGIDGPLTYRPGTAFCYDVNGVSEGDIRVLRQRWQSSSYPTHFAIYPKQFDATTGTRWMLTLYPTPDAAYELSYRQKYKAPALTSGQYLMGGVEHAQTILASCLAVAEGGKGPKRDEFLLLLTSSIEIDQMEGAPESLGTNSDWNEFQARGDYYTNRSTRVTVEGVAYE